MESESGSLPSNAQSAASEGGSALNSQNNDEIMEDNSPNAQISQAVEQLAEPPAEKGLKTKLECLKAIVDCIRSNINRNAVVPQQAIAFNGVSTAEKLRNLGRPSNVPMNH